jgi:hypothetical protein
LLAAPLLLNSSIIIAVAARSLSRLSSTALRRSCSVLAILLILVSFVSWQSWAFAKANWLKPVVTKLDPAIAAQPCEFSVWLDKYSKPGDYVMFLNDTATPGYPLTLLSKRRPCLPFLWGYPIRLLADCNITEKELPPELINSPQQAFDKTYVEIKLTKLIQERVPKLMFIQQGRTEDYLRKHEKINLALIKKLQTDGRGEPSNATKSRARLHQWLLVQLHHLDENRLMTDHTSKKVMGLDPLQIFGLSFTAAALLAVLFVILIHPMRIGFDQAKY